MAQIRVDLLAICFGGLVLTSMLVVTATQDAAQLSMRWFLSQGLLAPMLLGGLCWGVLQHARGLGGFIASASILAGMVLGFTVGAMPINVEASVAAATLAAVLIGGLMVFNYASPYEITSGALFAAVSGVGGTVVAMAAQSFDPTISAVTGFGAAMAGFGVGALLARIATTVIGEVVLRVISGVCALSAILVAGFNHSPAPMRFEQQTSTPDPLAIVSNVMNEAEVERVISALLLRMHAAFEQDTQEGLYAELGRAVTGDSLTELYEQRRHDLALPLRNGAALQEVNVKGFNLLRGERQVNAYRAQIGWEVLSVIESETHDHIRRNIYQAEVLLEPVGGAWRLTEVDLSKQHREITDDVARPGVSREEYQRAIRAQGLQNRTNP